MKLKEEKNEDCIKFNLGLVNVNYELLNIQKKKKKKRKEYPFVKLMPVYIANEIIKACLRFRFIFHIRIFGQLFLFSKLTNIYIYQYIPICVKVNTI